MTHNELLKKIDWIGNTKNAETKTFSTLGVAVFASLNALRAVVELHKPDKSGKYCQAHDECWGCGEWGFENGHGVKHTGLEHYLTEYGCEVYNVSLGGCCNRDSVNRITSSVQSAISNVSRATTDIAGDE